jgi:MFS family permease
MGEMGADAGWMPLEQPRRAGADSFSVLPFTRLARAHAAAVAGDTLIAIALAGSLFFDIDPSDARWKVGLYLALTMAPFAVVAPLIGPALDQARGGRRWMVVGASACRVVVCLFMIDDVDGLLLFPEAFAVLVAAKSYQVAKSALVPTVVHTDDELVEANSKLSLLSGVVGFATAIPGGIALKLGGSEAVLVLAVLVFAVAAALGFRLPATQVAAQPASAAERNELRGISIVLAASAMGLLRGIVGFLTMLLAFDLRTGDAPSWHFGVVLGVSVIGSLVGALVAPMLRRNTSEENILLVLLALTTVTGVGTAYVGDLTGAAILAFAVGIAASAGKQAFDALVQRDAPDANRGRSFARFETRFQLLWVVGAVIPVVIHLPARLGFLGVGIAAGFATFTFAAGLRAAHHRHPTPIP